MISPFACGIWSQWNWSERPYFIPYWPIYRAQNRMPIQILDEGRDSITSIHINTTEIITGSVDGHIRTYDIRKGELRSDYVGHPVTSICPTNDGKTILASTLDSTLRLFDTNNGTLLNSFEGHKNEAYRTRACFGFGEASVICGDEDGLIWSWDLISVCSISFTLRYIR